QTLDRLAAQTAEELSQVDEIGTVIAESVAQFFRSPVGQEIVRDFRELELDFSAATTQAPLLSDKLAGQIVVVTGTLPSLSRDEAHALIEQHGGKTSGSVSKKTTLLLAGEEAGSKLQKAKDLGVKIVDEAVFRALLEN
ncbi:MAG: BRCT domain-containing protein, partial [Planctomycetota bacterium]